MTCSPAALAPLAWASSLTSPSLKEIKRSLSTFSTNGPPPFSKRPKEFMRPVLSSSLKTSISPDPQIPSAAPPPMTFARKEPSGSIATFSMAPGKAGMPQEILPPSNAGPAGQEAARILCLLPRISSVLVPMSMSATRRSSFAKSTASRQAAASAPT